MARLQLDNLIFSLPVVETTNRRSADQPLEPDAFQKQLQKAGSPPASSDRPASTSARERTQSQRDKQNQTDGPSQTEPASTAPPQSAKSSEKQQPHDDADQDDLKSSVPPIEKAEKKQDKLVETDPLPVPVAPLAAQAAQDASTKVDDVAAAKAVTDSTGTKTVVDPKQAQSAAGVAKTTSTKPTADKPADDPQSNVTVEAITSNETQKAVRAAAELKPEAPQSNEVPKANSTKDKPGREHTNVDNQVIPELPVAVKQTTEQQGDKQTQGGPDTAVKTTHRQNDDNGAASAAKSATLNETSATSATAAPPTPLANAPATIDSSAANSAVPNTTTAAIAVANQPANLRSADANGPAAITDQPLRTGVSSGSRTAPTEKPTGLTQGERARLVQRVSRAFHSIGEDGGQLRLRLSPAELGSLKLEVTLKDGTLTARMETETEAARNLLVEHLPQLRERLAEQGIKIESFDIDLMNQSSGGPADNAGERANQGQSSAYAARGNSPDSAPNTTATEPAARPRAAGNSELDLLI